MSLCIPIGLNHKGEKKNWQACSHQNMSPNLQLLHKNEGFSFFTDSISDKAICGNLVSNKFIPCKVCLLRFAEMKDDFTALLVPD